MQPINQSMQKNFLIKLFHRITFCRKTFLLNTESEKRVAQTFESKFQTRSNNGREDY